MKNYELLLFYSGIHDLQSIIIGLPILEIWIMIKVGTQIGALNTILLIL